MDEPCYASHLDFLPRRHLITDDTLAHVPQLPPHEEEEFGRRMSFDVGKMGMFRARATRKNIWYEVVCCAESEGAED